MGEELLRQFEAHPLRSNFPPFAGFRDVESKAFYGTGYQDVAHRKPSIENAKRLLNWEPTVEMSRKPSATPWISSCVKPCSKSRTSADAGRSSH